MKVYTFHTPIKAIEDPKLLDVWAESWRRNGWEPAVIGPQEAVSHPMYWEYCAKVSAFPTTNPREFELACYARWLAMAQIGGGMMTDADCINYGFTTDDAAALQGGKLVVLDGYVPCAVIGNADQYLAVARAFMDYVYWGQVKHLSDMILIHTIAPSPLYEGKSVCVEYPKPGWDSAKLVHFTSSVLGRPRGGRIAELRPLTEALQPA